MKRWMWIGLLMAGWLACASGGQAIAIESAKPVGADPKLSQKITDSNRILREFMSAKDTVPQDAIRDARAVIVFSDAVRAGFLITGNFAQGVALSKDSAGNWSAPAFFRISGMGVGLQIGGDVSDIVFVIRDEDGLNKLLEQHFTMGADASATAGSAGRQAKAMRNKDTGIVAFGKSKGLFAGVSFDGAVVKQDLAANEKYYGQRLEARDILLNGRATMTAESRELANTLRSYSGS